MIPLISIIILISILITCSSLVEVTIAHVTGKAVCEVVYKHVRTIS